MGKDGGGQRFEDLVGDVRPLADRDREHAPEARRPGRAPARDAPATPPAFLRDEGPGSGRAADAARSLVAALRQGKHPVERRVDLHGHRREAARRTLLHHLDAALQAGERCLLVIHGAGGRSTDGPVLREALPGWLEAWPSADRLLAYTRAPAGLGGDGATLVLLRRRR